MSGPLIYVDTSRVRDGALEELKGAIAELADFIKANEPWLLAYEVYFSEDGTRMTVLHVHSDSSSLERHMEVAGPRFAKFGDLLSLSSIQIYGEPSDKVLTQLRGKAQLLGGNVVSTAPHVGFTRFGRHERT